MKLVYKGRMSLKEIEDSGPQDCEISNCKEELNAFQMFKLIIVPRKLVHWFITCDDCSNKIRDIIEVEKILKHDRR